MRCDTLMIGTTRNQVRKVTPTVVRPPICPANPPFKQIGSMQKPESQAKNCGRDSLFPLFYGRVEGLINRSLPSLALLCINQTAQAAAQAALFTRLIYGRTKEATVSVNTVRDKANNRPHQSAARSTFRLISCVDDLKTRFHTTDTDSATTDAWNETQTHSSFLWSQNISTQNHFPVE